MIDKDDWDIWVEDIVLFIIFILPFIVLGGGFLFALFALFAMIAGK